jgi:hypothetical protein
MIPLHSQSKHDLPELVHQSSLIVRAKVKAFPAQRITNQHGRHIYTTAHREHITALSGTTASTHKPGSYNVGFDAGKYRMQAGKYQEIKKMVFL